MEQVSVNGETYAIILRASDQQPGIRFHTRGELSQQLASMCYPAGKKIDAHTHNEVPRHVSLTQEALFIRRGKIRVDFYSQDRSYQSSRILNAGDVILLITGGHGFEVIEDLDMIEVKQGPYAGDADKTRFDTILPDVLVYE